MLLDKNALPNLGNDTKSQIFNGNFSLYELSDNDSYALVLDETLMFVLNSTGTATEQISSLDGVAIKSQVYFKNTHRDSININVTL